MRRPGNFALAGFNTAVATVQVVALVHEFARNAAPSEAATTMLLLVLNLALAGWFVGRGLEVDR